MIAHGSIYFVLACVGGYFFKKITKISQKILIIFDKYVIIN